MDTNGSSREGLASRPPPFPREQTQSLRAGDAEGNCDRSLSSAEIQSSRETGTKEKLTGELRAWCEHRFQVEAGGGESDETSPGTVALLLSQHPSIAAEEAIYFGQGVVAE